MEYVCVSECSLLSCERLYSVVPFVCLFRPLRWEEDLKSSRLAVAGRPSLACLLPREFAGQPARRHWGSAELPNLIWAHPLHANVAFHLRTSLDLFDLSVYGAEVAFTSVYMYSILYISMPEW